MLSTIVDSKDAKRRREAAGVAEQASRPSGAAVVDASPALPAACAAASALTWDRFEARSAAVIAASAAEAAFALATEGSMATGVGSAATGSTAAAAVSAPGVRDVDDVDSSVEDFVDEISDGESNVAHDHRGLRSSGASAALASRHEGAAVEGFERLIAFDEMNPKRLGSQSWDRYEKYKFCRTVEEATRKGASRQDIQNNHKMGYLIYLDGPPPSGAATPAAPANATPAAGAEHQARRRLRRVDDTRGATSIASFTAADAAAGAASGSAAGAASSGASRNVCQKDSGRAPPKSVGRARRGNEAS